jgi:hypothetical protein
MSPGGGSAPDVVIVGSASRDLAPADPRGWRLGGAVSYGGLTVARLGVRVGMIVGVDGPGAAAEELDWCRAAGAEVVVIPLERSPVFDNEERPGGRVQQCLEPGDPLPIPPLPETWRAAPWWLLAPVAGELGDAWAGVPVQQSLVGLGWQGLLRALRAGEEVRPVPPRASRLLDRASLVAVSANDLPPGSQPEVLAPLLAADAELLVTEAETGGVHARFGGGRVQTRERWVAVPASRVVDPTGAGDVFLATVVAARSGMPGPELEVAAAAASLVVEGHGMSGVPTADAVAARLAGRR